MGLFSSDGLQSDLETILEKNIQLLDFKDEIELAILNSNRDVFKIENGLKMLQYLEVEAKIYFSQRTDHVLKLFPFWKGGYQTLDEILMTIGISFTVSHNEGVRTINCLKYTIGDIGPLGKVQLDNYNIGSIITNQFEEYYINYIVPTGFDIVKLTNDAEEKCLSDKYISKYLNIKFDEIKRDLPDFKRYVRSQLLQLRGDDK